MGRRLCRHSSAGWCLHSLFPKSRALTPHQNRGSWRDPLQSKDARNHRGVARSAATIVCHRHDQHSVGPCSIRRFGAPTATFADRRRSPSPRPARHSDAAVDEIAPVQHRRVPRSACRDIVSRCCPKWRRAGTEFPFGGLPDIASLSRPQRNSLPDRYPLVAGEHGIAFAGRLFFERFSYVRHASHPARPIAKRIGQGH
jgi:hypothetical protein